MHDIDYDMIFKRKSFHVFREVIPMTQQELDEIEGKLSTLLPLVEDIKVAIRLVPKEQTTCKRGEYCVLIYSEHKEMFLQNVGYMGEQLDLWLAARNIGVCWYGLARPHEMSHQGLDFVMMLAIGKTNEKYFRKDYKKASRRPLDQIWNGERHEALAIIVRYAPSACNSQPWYLECSEKQITLHRILGKKSLIPQSKMTLINRVDMGIMLCFLEVCLGHHQFDFSRELFPDEPYETEKALANDAKVRTATYSISEKV